MNMENTIASAVIVVIALIYIYTYLEGEK